MRAEVVVESPEVCPVDEFADCDESTVEIASRGEEYEEVFLTEEPPESAADSLSRIFEYEDGGIFRFTRPDECACDRLEAVGVPVHESRFEAGGLQLVFHVENTDELRDAIETLRRRAETVRVKRLVDSGSTLDPTTISTVDLRELTDRQAEVVEAAHREGYFEHPRHASISDLARQLDLSPSTVTQHLYTAMGKVFDQVVE